MVTRLVCSPTPVSRYIPSVIIAAPTIGSTLYRPVFVVTWPEISAVTVEPSIIGISIRPLCVGDRCCTVCWYSGRNVSAPNSARPSRKLIAMATEKLRLRNTLSGRIGSAARASMTRNAAVETSPITASPMTCTEPHAYWVPPQVVIRMIAVAAMARATAPP